MKMKDEKEMNTYIWNHAHVVILLVMTDKLNRKKKLHLEL